MSRSNPTTENRHPCTRWHEWDGANGVVRFYDKQSEKNISCGDKFTFILLDELAVIKGWNDAKGAGITSNEVRNVSTDVMTVKVFKGGTIATGLYSEIKSSVKEAGGHYTANLYIGYKDNGALKIGSLQLKGAALNAWVEFKNENKVYDKSVQIDGASDDKKGAVKFKVPIFKISEITPETNDESIELDKTLQAYLKEYLKGTVSKSTGEGVQEDAPSDLPEDRRDIDEKNDDRIYVKERDGGGDEEDAF